MSHRYRNLVLACWLRDFNIVQYENEMIIILSFDETLQLRFQFKCISVNRATVKESYILWVHVPENQYVATLSYHEIFIIFIHPIKGDHYYHGERPNGKNKTFSWKFLRFNWSVKEFTKLFVEYLNIISFVS